MKTCRGCGVEKPLTEYYKHSGMTDGYLNHCKDCKKGDATAHRQKNLDRYRQYDRERGSRQTPEDQRAYRSKYPKKARARRKVAYHIQKGYLTAQPCEECGEEKTHAHHDDYDLPLGVRWLCAAHHHQWHAKHGEAKNAS